MAASPRGDRRRRRRAGSTAAAPAGKPGGALLNVNEAAAAGLLAGFALLFVGIALLASGGTGDGGVTTSPGDSAAASDGGATTDAVQPATSDEEAIQWLARRSIEVLPAGQWPSLYDSFTSEFQQRCPREEFGQVGEDTATEWGDNLQLLGFKRVESVIIEGSTAQAVIVGEVVGQSEYQIQAAFQKEDGAWKIAPAPDTQGCEAFLSG
jgi:hypothetical protein